VLLRFSYSLSNSHVYFLLFACLLIGCDQNIVDNMAENTNVNSVESINFSELNLLSQTEFLDATQGSVAATWLALKDKSSDSQYIPEVSEVAIYETQLIFIKQKLLEDRRMVANRTVQIRDILAKDNIQIPLITLLEGLSEVADQNIVGTYSDYCGWYITFRQSQLDHQTAIQKMKLLRRKQS